MIIKTNETFKYPAHNGYISVIECYSNYWIIIASYFKNNMTKYTV